MIKESQKRDLSDRISDHGLSSVKEWFNKPLQRKMMELKSTDDKIRSIIYNKKVGKEESGLGVAGGLKELISLMRKNAGRMEYIEVFTLLGDFHKIMSELKVISAKTYEKFKGDYKEVLTQDVDSEKRKKLLEIGERLRNATYTNYTMTKEAGIMDWFKSISKGFKRGRELKYWAENNKKEAERLKSDTTRLLNYSEKLFEMIENKMKAMSTDLVRRNTVQYAKNCAEIVKITVEFDRQFKEYSKVNISPILEDLRKAHEAEEKEQEAAKIEKQKAEEEERKALEKARVKLDRPKTPEEVQKALEELSGGKPPKETTKPKGKSTRKKKSESEYKEIMKGIRKLAHMNIK